MEVFRPGIDSPAKYTLNVGGGNIDVDVSRRTTLPFSNIPQDNMSRVQRELDLPDAFIPQTSDREWGFGPVISQIERNNSDWITFRSSMPKSEGEYKMDWDKLRALSATLAIFFDYLNGVEPADSNIPHLATIRLSLRSRSTHMHGAPISVRVEPALARWAQNNTNTKNEGAVLKTMKEAYYRMTGEKKRKYEDLDFRVNINPPRKILLDCPGDACGLGFNYGTSIEKGPDASYDLTPHNTDSPIQQITLLAGVAKIVSIAAKDYRSE